VADLALNAGRFLVGFAPCRFSIIRWRNFAPTRVAIRGPADFDSYWDAAIAEMKAVDPRVELVPYKSSSRVAECFDLYFTGTGGSRVHAKYLRPKSAPKPHPAVLLFHGYTNNSGDWFDKFAWVSQGYAVAALDCRGQGGRSQDLGGVTGNTMRGQIIRGLDDPPQKLLFRQIFLDTAQLANIVMQMPESIRNGSVRPVVRRAAG
jgi:cephalosporin-C deacetylase